MNTRKPAGVVLLGCSFYLYVNVRDANMHHGIPIRQTPEHHESNRVAERVVQDWKNQDSNCKKFQTESTLCFNRLACLLLCTNNSIRFSYYRIY